MKNKTIYYIFLWITVFVFSFKIALGIAILDILIRFVISSIKELVTKINVKKISTSPFSIFLFIFWFQIINYIPKYIWIATSRFTDFLDKGLVYIFSLPSPKEIIMDPMPTMFEWFLKIINDINISRTFKDLEGSILILIFFLICHLMLSVIATCLSLMFIHSTKEEDKTKSTEPEKEEITEVV